MRQTLLEIPIPFTDKHLPIFGFGLMLCIGFFAATWLAQRLCRREGLDGERIMDLSLWLFISGIVGARLLFMVRNPDQFNGLLDFFKIWQGGIVFYGGVVAATLVFIYYTRRYQLPALRVLDVAAPAVAIGIGVGRIGCLLNGCCWGKQTELPWAVSFPANSLPWQAHVHSGWINDQAARSLPVHPTQIYLAIAGWLLAGLILAYFPRRRRHGEVMALLMVGYSVTRFAIEFLRDDEPLWADGLTISQNISIAIFVGGFFLWGWLRRYSAISTVAQDSGHPRATHEERAMADERAKHHVAT